MSCAWCRRLRLWGMAGTGPSWEQLPTPAARTQQRRKARSITTPPATTSGNLAFAINEQGEPDARLLRVGPLNAMAAMRWPQQGIARPQGDCARLVGNPNPGSATKDGHPLSFRLVVPEPLG
jgi:hypothetical protein